jgi:hypothetical protein
MPIHNRRDIPITIAAMYRLESQGSKKYDKGQGDENDVFAALEIHVSG